MEEQGCTGWQDGVVLQFLTQGPAPVTCAFLGLLWLALVWWAMDYRWSKAGTGTPVGDNDVWVPGNRTTGQILANLELARVSNGLLHVGEEEKRRKPGLGLKELCGLGCHGRMGWGEILFGAGERRGGRVL